jgi:tetratricopeptide (TPR) repeat protein
VIFSVVGLVVVFSLVVGTILYGLDTRGAGDGDAGQDPASAGGQANLVPTYEARLRANPDDLDAMLLLANILQNRGDYAGAIGQYNRAVELRPDDLRIRLAFGQALANYGQRSDAEAQYRRALELDHNSPEAEYALGQLYARWDPPRTEEARQHYTRASDLQPEGSWGRAAREALDRLNATPTP